jgi:MoxR-like ATPase
MPEDWRLAEAVLHAQARSEDPRPVLLYGPPATGKTYAAQRIGVEPQRTINVYLDEESAAFDVLGHQAITGGNTDYVLGFGIKAWQEGAVLILNEIDKASPSALSAIYQIADDRESASWRHPVTGEIITPAPGFMLRATSNVNPGDFVQMDGLVSRFAIRLLIDNPHPNAIARLPQELQEVARVTCGPDCPPERRLDLRAFYSYVSLCDAIGSDDAGNAAFGPAWVGVRDAMAAAAMRKER